MDKLTLFGGLRDTKLELRGGLGAPKEASRGAKRATITIEPRAKCLISEPRGSPKYLSKLRYKYYRTGRTGGLSLGV